MPVPDFQSMMLPLLEFADDGKEHTQSEVREFMVKRFGLGAGDLAERTTNGGQTKFANRIAWAKMHLQAAGLLKSVRWGVFRITPAGSALLARNVKTLGIRQLEEFESYRAFRKQASKKVKEENGKPVSAVEEATPHETLDQAFRVILDSLAAEVLALVKSKPPAFFEQLVIDLLVKMGYGGSQQDAARAVGKSGDEGIDGIIDEDRLGLDVIYVQAKKWEQTVQRPELQKFVGALQGKRARKGIFITTSEFSSGARDYVKAIDNKVVLIDGARLAELMIEFDVGVATVSTYAVKRVDTDFFEN
jgi:restriction system protein